jgi:RES domain-containing protein
MKICPDTYQLLEIGAADTLRIENIAPEQPDRISPAWRGDAKITRKFWASWFAENRTALVRVPSVILPNAWNVLLNPAHPDAAGVKIISVERVPYDPRLFHGAEQF